MKRNNLCNRIAIVAAILAFTVFAAPRQAAACSECPDTRPIACLPCMGFDQWFGSNAVVVKPVYATDGSISAHAYFYPAGTYNGQHQIVLVIVDSQGKQSVCFVGASETSMHAPKNPAIDSRVSVTGSSGSYSFTGADGSTVSQSGSVVTWTSPTGGTTTWTFSESPVNSSAVLVSIDYPDGTHVNVSPAYTLTQKSLVNGTETVRDEFIRRSSDTIKRHTVKQRNSDGTYSYLTTLYGRTGTRIDFIVNPDMVVKYLADHPGISGVNVSDPGASCGLDSLTASNLTGYKSVEYTYDGNGTVISVTGTGCSSCGGSSGTTTYSYGVNSSYPSTPSDEQKYNLWKTYKRTVSAGVQTVEFANADGAIIYHVTQDASGTAWITHTKYGYGSSAGGSLGKVVEERSPSACTGYSVTRDQNNWVIDITAVNNGTTGLVRLYEYDPNGNRTVEKVRQGTSDTGTAYYVHKYHYTQPVDGGTTYPVYFVDEDTTYPTETASDTGGVTTDYEYAFTFANGTFNMTSMTVTYPAVSSSNPDHHGMGQTDTVIYHYLKGPYGTWYNDWTKNRDGSLTYTAVDSNGRTVKTIQDVNTATTGDFYTYVYSSTTGYTSAQDLLPAGWSSSSGRHLITEYTYDADGNVVSVTTTGQTSKECRTRCYVSDKEGTTTYLVTLRTSFVDSSGHYDYLPLDITVTDPAGRMVVSATGMATTGTDGNLANDWSPTGSVDVNFSAFAGTLLSRTTYSYNAQGRLSTVSRWSDADNSGATQLQTTYDYDSSTGRQQLVKSPEGAYAFTKYDAIGRAKQTWVGSNAAGASQASPQGTTGNNLVLVSEVYYDEAAAGSSTDGVGDGNITSSRNYYGSGSYYLTINNFDYRGRQTATMGSDNAATVIDYDNQDRQTETRTYGGATLTSGAIVTTSAVLRAKSQTQYDERGQVYQTVVYDTTSGSSATMATNYWYDAAGRQCKVAPPGGVAYTKTFYDGTGSVTYEVTCSAEGNMSTAWDLKDDIVLSVSKSVYAGGQLVSQMQGTSLGLDSNGKITGNGDMVTVSKTWYNTAYEDNTVVAMPYVTGVSTLKASASAGENDFVLTKYGYTNGRQSKTIYADPDGSGSLLETKVENTFDDLGRVTDTSTYAGSGSSWTLLSSTGREYGSNGQLSSVKKYKVVSGAKTDPVATTYSYDSMGRQCKVTMPSGGFTKTQYDAYGRVTGTYLCSDEGIPDDATTPDGDTIVEQTVPSYDSTGAVWMTARTQRNHNGAGTARTTYQVAWFDDLHRPVKTAYYGTNDGVALTGQSSDFDPVAVDTQTYAGDFGVGVGKGPRTNSSAAMIVSQTDYDGYGRAYKTTDNCGIVTLRVFDAATGRMTHSIENYQPGSTCWTINGSNAEVYDSPLSRDTYINRVTKYEYTATGQLATMTAVDPDHNGNTSDNQATTYTYSDGTTSGGTSSCIVPRKDLLAKVAYPDSTGDTDTVRMTYYANGALYTRTDQRNVLITYSYDDLGRQTMQNVTLPSPTEVDDYVTKLQYAYDNKGRVVLITSLGSSDVVRNEVKNTYDGYGMLSKQEQNPEGAVVTDVSPKLEYTYDSCLRQATVTYPNGRKLHYYYGTSGSVSDRLGLLAGIAPDNNGSPDTSNLIVSYDYIGAGTVARKNYPVPQQRLDYWGDYSYTNKTLTTTDGTYAGLDKFGRVTRQMWRSSASDTTASTFDIKHGYDAASNRTYADNQVYTGSSQAYTYDALNRLTDTKTGFMPTAGTVMTDWTSRKQAWTLDQLGNQTAENDFRQTSWYANAFNKANEMTTRDTKMRIRNMLMADSFAATDEFGQTRSADRFINPGTNDAYTINNPAGCLKFTTVAADTIDGSETKAFVLSPHAFVPSQISGNITLPAGTTNGYAGYVFGYKDANNFWMHVIEMDNGTGYERLYHVENGVKGTAVESVAITVTPGTSQWHSSIFRRKNVNRTISHNFTDGVPSGKIGMITNVQNTTFDLLRVQSDDNPADVLGRWMQFDSTYNNDNSVVTYPAGGGDRLYLHLFGVDSRKPKLLKNVRLKKFQATFQNRTGYASEGGCFFVFGARDQDSYNMLYINSKPSTPVNAPLAYKSVDGNLQQYISNTARDNDRVPAIAAASDPMWIRVECKEDNSVMKVMVYCQATDSSDTPPSEESWGSKLACFTANLSEFTNTDGGYIGFAGGYQYIDDLTIKAWDETAGAWKSTPEVVENFTLTSGVGRDTMVHDAAGNLTYDGLNQYYYDAWNRLAKVKRAYRDAAGDVQTGSQIASMGYDALGRRVIKDISNSGDWDCKYMYYFDGTRKVEKRNATQCVLEQFVWGGQYVDELVQVGLNEDPLHAISGENQENTCEQFYWVMQDANYNVLGVVNNTGDLTERYEYTPYGQRRIYTSSNAPVLESTHGAFGSALAAAHIADSLCDFGHQGLEHDKEIGGGLIHDGSRYTNPTFGTFMQNDMLGTPLEPPFTGDMTRPKKLTHLPGDQYKDGMNIRQYVGNNPMSRLDPTGLWSWKVSSDVYTIQTILNNNAKRFGLDMGNYGPGNNGIDGQYGKTTKAAVCKFQNALKALGYNVDTDGKWGPATTTAFEQAEQAGKVNYRYAHIRLGLFIGGDLFASWSGSGVYGGIHASLREQSTVDWNFGAIGFTTSDTTGGHTGVECSVVIAWNIFNNDDWTSLSGKESAWGADLGPIKGALAKHLSKNAKLTLDIITTVIDNKDNIKAAIDAVVAAQGNLIWRGVPGSVAGSYGIGLGVYTTEKNVKYYSTDFSIGN